MILLCPPPTLPGIRQTNLGYLFAIRLIGYLRNNLWMSLYSFNLSLFYFIPMLTTRRSASQWLCISVSVHKIFKNLHSLILNGWWEMMSTLTQMIISEKSIQLTPGHVKFVLRACPIWRGLMNTHFPRQSSSTPHRVRNIFICKFTP